jgi:hypothetical protein
MQPLHFDSPAQPRERARTSVIAIRRPSHSMTHIEENRRALSYALPDVNRRRWSTLAIVSLLIPVFALPLDSAIAHLLPSHFLTVWSQRLNATAIGIAGTAGVAITVVTLNRIRCSASPLRGRLLALIGLALDVVLIFLAVTLLYMMRDQ